MLKAPKDTLPTLPILPYLSSAYFTVLYWTFDGKRVVPLGVRRTKHILPYLTYIETFNTFNI